MPRVLSWLPRLHEIRRSIQGSSRSHYTRKELEDLFQLQPRAAQKLLEILPTTAVGTSHLIEREALAHFLDQIHAADNPSAALEAIRQQKQSVSRRKIRSLVRKNTEPVTLASLPPNLRLRPGCLEVTFNTIEELAQTMYALAQAMETDGDELARLFERRTAAAPDPDREAVALMMKELLTLEAGREGGT
jgi:hypothetical protein